MLPLGSFHPNTTPLQCAYCNQPLELETTKTDEDGRAVHEECYVSKEITPIFANNRDTVGGHSQSQLVNRDRRHSEITVRNDYNAVSFPFLP